MVARFGPQDGTRAVARHRRRSADARRTDAAVRPGRPAGPDRGRRHFRRRTRGPPGRRAAGGGAVTVHTGWQGRFYEDFVVGDVYEHPLGRTVTTTDNIWFTLLTQNTAP